MIEAYLQSLLEAVAKAAEVASSDIALDKRGPQAGLIRGDIYFIELLNIFQAEMIYSNKNYGILRSDTT